MEYIINETDVVNLLEAMVAIDSPYFEEEQIMEYAHEWLLKNDIPSQIHHYKEEKVTGFHGKNIVSEISKGIAGPVVCLNGHLDTVKLCEGWTRSSKGIREGNRFYGRGALDMKSGCVANMMALKAFVSNHKTFKGKIISTLVSDEEGPYGLGTNALIQDGYLDDVDVSVITEPSAGFCEKPFPVLCLGARGGYGLTVEFFGKAAHAASPQNGLNAVEEASRFVGEIKNVSYIHDSFLGRGDACVIGIQGDGGACSVPDYAKVTLFWHIVVGEDKETICTEVEKAIKRANIKASYKIKFRPVPSEGADGFLPYKVEKENTMAKNFMDAIKNTCGETFDIQRFSSIGDFNYLGTRIHAPALVFGPSGENFHGPDEYVNIDSVVKTAQVVYTFLEKILVKEGGEI